jgi:hypothetical protein
MATFKDSRQVYETIGAFLTQIATDAEFRPKFAAAQLRFLVHYTEPDCDILMDCTVDPPVVSCGATADAEIKLTMSADDGHLFWLGKLNMPLALAKSKVKVEGPVSKMMKLLPAIRPAFPRYQAFLEQQGHAGMASI